MSYDLLLRSGRSFPKRGLGLLMLLAGLGYVPLRAAVPSADITLQAPVQDKQPVLSPLTGYELGENAAADTNKDTPVYSPYDSTSDAWWDNLVAELLQARITHVTFATRGTGSNSPGDLTGFGNMNPRRLYQFVDAATRAGVASQFKLSCMIDAPSAEQIYTSIYGLAAGTKENMADNSTGVTNHWQEVWWLRVIKPWFDTIPQSMWYTINGHPRIEFWGQDNATINQQGNYSGMINYVTSQMQTAYGVTPVFVGQSSDTAFNSNPLVIGYDRWFAPPNDPFRYFPTPTDTNPNGYTHKAGALVPGFIDPNFYNAGATNYNNWNRVIKRNKVDGSGVNGDTLKGALAAAFSANVDFCIMEGWTNLYESAGFYRVFASHQDAWDYPNQYINILRPYTDMRTVTLRLEAEGCDEYGYNAVSLGDSTPGNTGGAYLRPGEDLDVRALTGNPLVSSSSVLSGYPATNGMDGSFSSKWIANGALPQWLQYDYGSGRACAINTYYVTSSDDSADRRPKNWDLLGSNNGTAWNTLNSQSNQTFTGNRSTNAYTFTNTTAYRYYRLNVTAAGGSTVNLSLGDFRLKGGTATGSGWVVTGTASGEWIKFYGVHCSSGYYKFPIRYSSTASHTVRLTVDGVALPDVILPATGNMNTFDTAYMGGKALLHGTHTYKVTFVDGGVDVDWIFAKKTDRMVSFKSELTDCYLTIEQGGNSTFSSNRTTEGVWEKFSMDSLPGSSGNYEDGDVVNLQGYIGYYVTAEGDGGGTLTNNRRQQGIYEQFTLVKVSGSAGDTIQSGDEVALESHDGTHYVTVVNGSTVNVTGTSIDDAQTFIVNFSNQ